MWAGRTRTTTAGARACATICNAVPSRCEGGEWWRGAHTLAARHGTAGTRTSAAGEALEALLAHALPGSVVAHAAVGALRGRVGGVHRSGFVRPRGSPGAQACTREMVRGRGREGNVGQVGVTPGREEDTAGPTLRVARRVRAAAGSSRALLQQGDSECTHGGRVPRQGWGVTRGTSVQGRAFPAERQHAPHMHNRGRGGGGVGRRHVRSEQSPPPQPSQQAHVVRLPDWQSPWPLHKLLHCAEAEASSRAATTATITPARPARPAPAAPLLPHATGSCCIKKLSKAPGRGCSTARRPCSGVGAAAGERGAWVVRLPLRG
jgi:hypothetical protein